MGHFIFVPKLCFLGDVPNAIVDSANLIDKLSANRLASGPNSATSQHAKFFHGDLSGPTDEL